MRMKGIMSIIEVMITGIILFVALVHFFPQYSIRSDWSKAFLMQKVRDTLNTIDRLNKTYEFAKSGNKAEFEKFMNSTFKPEALIWWREVRDLDGQADILEIPPISEGYREFIIDVVNTSSGFDVYAFGIGLGYPY